MCVCVCVCVWSNSRNDVPRVAQRYGTIAAHTRRRAFVLFVFVVFCVHIYSFAGMIRRTPPPTFSDTAIIDRHSDTTIFTRKYSPETTLYTYGHIQLIMMDGTISQKRLMFIGLTPCLTIFLKEDKFLTVYLLPMTSENFPKRFIPWNLPR